MRLNNLVTIVTGGAAGIGRAYARRFLEEGARVVIGDIVDPSSTAKDLASLGDVFPVQCDVSSFADANRLIQSAIERFGKLDVLVNNAAVFASLVPVPLEEIADEEWDRVMAVNVKGVWNCVRAAAPLMKQQRSGKIINVSSPTFHKGTPMLLHYVASKGAVIGLTRTMARELGTYGICVNAIAPGLTLSDTLLKNPNLQFQSEAVMASRALKRDQAPADLEGTAVFLASDDSAFITGQTIIVDGGSAIV